MMSAEWWNDKGLKALCRRGSGREGGGRRQPHAGSDALSERGLCACDGRRALLHARQRTSYGDRRTLYRNEYTTLRLTLT